MKRMTDMRDAYGHEVYDWFRGIRPVLDIVERDDGYIDASSGAPFVYFAEYTDWPPVEKKGIRLARGRVLDIGCGAGRCLLYLQQKGLNAVGIDNSPLAIKVCRERGAKEVHLCSITDIGPHLGIFDSIIMYGNNFGLFGSYSRAKRLLKTMHKMTTPSARIIAESSHVYKIDVPEHLWYQKHNRRRGRMSGQNRIRVRYKKFVSSWFDYLLVSPAEAQDIVSGTGWEIRKFIHDSGRFYIMVLEKEGPKPARGKK